jgi:hypothetical protein
MKAVTLPKKQHRDSIATPQPINEGLIMGYIHLLYNKISL